MTPLLLALACGGQPAPVASSDPTVETVAQQITFTIDGMRRVNGAL